MSNISISLRNLSKCYFLYDKPFHRVLETFHPRGKKYHKTFQALKDISLEVKHGEAIGIIGRNGSGKSTLLQLICGNLQPTEGQVVVNGRISALLELGAGFHPEFTGRENVYLSTAILGLSREIVDARFDQIVNFADIGDYIDQPVRSYSSGMYVRLAFATAISVDPEILIIDEALTVGDIFFQQKCMEHMKKLMQACTIVLVSHDTHSVVNLCSRVVVLDHGNVLYEGEPVEGVTQYTKILQNEQFSKKGKKKRVPEQILQQNIPEKVLDSARSMAPDFDKWIVVEDDKRSGDGEVSILRASIIKNDLPVVTVQRGEVLTIRLFICAAAQADEIIFGYTVKDRIGNAVFGENSLCLDEKAISLSEGFSLVEYNFSWPEVFPWEYSITVGIGEGTLPLGHVVQCWAHDIFSVSAVTPGKVVHGMFNNRLESISVRSIK